MAVYNIQEISGDKCKENYVCYRIVVEPTQGNSTTGECAETGRLYPE